MLRTAVFALATTALAGAATLALTAAPAAQAAQAAASTGPQYGTFGFDAAGMDRSVAPGDDFYLYADGTWGKNTPIPADKASIGMFEGLQDLSDDRTHGLLEAAKADPSSKIGAAYTSFLNTAAIETKGLKPIAPWLNRIKSLKSRANQDPKNPEAYILQLRQSGLGMPDRDYYLSPDPKLAETKTAYQAHLARMLSLAGEPNAAARAAAIVTFETGIANVSWTRIDSRDADKTYNRMSVTDLTKLAPGFDFPAYFRGNGTLVNTVVVGQPTAVAGIAALIAKTPIGVLRDQLLVRSLETYAPVLPKAFDAENFAFAGTVLSGTPEQLPRWRRAVQFTSSILTDDVSKIYVAKYFPPATKAAADAMVHNIIAAMNARIERLEWMSPETKVKAHAKLAAFTPRIGYPTQWRDYSTLVIKPDDAFGNAQRASRWAQQYNANKLGKPIYRWEWGLTPMTVNAQANPTLVAITFPAAILQPPFFDPNADPAVNYGGIGAVIGHEMSHHFDDQGSKFDATGRLTQWWTDADVAKFKALSQRLVDEYDRYEPLPGFHVKGALTLGENSADLAGLNSAYDAYHNSLGGGEAPVIDGLTGDQRFYLGWAQVWRRNYREANLRQRLLTDPHAPSNTRANIVRNMDPWYQAFGVQPGQKLYLAPADRVRIW